MHTPEAAKELWCPMARIARDETVRVETAAIGGIVSVHEERHIVGGCNRDALHGGNRGYENGAVTHHPLGSCRCIADKCAMWRWAYTTESVPADIEGPSGAIVRTFEQRVTQTQGYCGLAPMALI